MLNVTEIKNTQQIQTEKGWSLKQYLQEKAENLKRVFEILAEYENKV